VGTALIHSLAATEKRGLFKSWTLLLSILAFSLSLLGTFLVRSGVLTSVHAFAVDPKRGIFILLLFGVFIGGALALYAWRTARIGLGGSFAPVSRESFLLANNVVLVAAAGAVFLGTLYPLALDALGGGKLSVGPPYFETVFVPLMAPALFLMGIGPLARWKRSSVPELAALLRWALAVSLVTGLVLPLLLGTWKPMVGFGLALALFIVLSTLVGYRKHWKQARAFHGMALAHIGVAVFVVGVTLVKGYEAEKDVALKEGEAVELAGYRFQLDDVGAVNGPNYKSARATISVSRGGKAVRTLHPEKRVYTVQEMPMTEAAIDTGPLRDLYVALGDPVGKDAWLVRVHYKPFISWIWSGCLLMALGGFLAASDRRYRVARKAAEKEAVQAA
jgi:cytochrome c-type biogenesis protein CcmF